MKNYSANRSQNPETEEQEERRMTIGTITKCDKLNLRAEPELNAKILYVIAPDEEVIVDPNFKDPTFYKVKVGDTIGYVVKLYLRIRK